ncbi:hypothetical protein PCANC_07974 [Puccinia coronata f. sp. avenae]|uniref:Rsm22-domain-containing protein n=1 Tax=Puccinia coronata f. sp. avenae TaxID=200324 RepID=A0A2N5UYQ2_9BASI|nr:hypothetical protein PCANC_07974 [Puccinia coronata f. sp. avenae]
MRTPRPRLEARPRIVRGGNADGRPPRSTLDCFAMLILNRPTTSFPRRSLALARRLLHHDPSLSKFLDDLSAHSSAQPHDPDFDPEAASLGVSRRSTPSEYGSTRQSIIKLPLELLSGVQDLVQSISHKSTIRTNALGLYGKYRLTSSKESLNLSNNHLMDAFLSERDANQDSKKLIKPKLSTTYDHLTSISFAAGAMPSAYGATLKVLLELKRKLNTDKIRRGLEHEWNPKTIIDYGSGTGSAAWAALEVWPDSIKEYNALDKSSSMNWINETLLKKRITLHSLGEETSKLKTSFRRITISPTQAEREKDSTTTHLKDWLNLLEKEESKQSSNLEIELEPSKYDSSADPDGLLAIISFTLSDLPNQAARRQAIEGMWNSRAETMVVIDRGTPAGFQVVADARQQLLMLGRREIRRARYERELESSEEENTDISSPEHLADLGSKDINLGSWVLAPCPHDKPCPLHLSDNPKHFCHFSQRIERPKFLKDTKHTSKHEEDAKFSYVIIRRGQRPPPPSISSDSSIPSDEPDSEFTPANSANLTSAAALEWPRIILPPHKCKGHVIFDVCAVSGEIERMTVPRSQGKQAYYDARKTFWGDSWPHGSKKPARVKNLQGTSGNRGDRRRKKKALNAQVDQ